MGLGFELVGGETRQARERGTVLPWLKIRPLIETIESS